MVFSITADLSVALQVGSVDRDDYYRFTLTNPQSNFNLSLFGQSDSAEVELIADDNHNGQVDYYEIINSDYGSRIYNANIRSNLGYGSLE